MADKKISQFPRLNAISASTIIPVVHDGTTFRMDVSSFAGYASQWSAKTGSSNTFSGNQTINGNLTLSGTGVIGGNLEVGGMITAQQYNVTYVSSSVQYQSGSTEFGDTADDTHTFTGTVIINGLAVNIPSLMAQTASQAGVNLGISSVTGSINTTTSSFNSVFLGISSVTASQDLVNRGISSVTGSINTTTASFDSVFLGISSVTGALNTFTQSVNSISGSYATTGSNTFRGNQAITGSLSVSAGEFNVITGSGNMTSSLIFDHTQNDGVTLGLRHNDRLSLADHTFNTQVWAGGVYTTFVRNGTPYSVLNVEAFDDNKIYLYRDTRLYNKSLVIDNNLTVQKDVVIGTGSLDIYNGEFSVTSGSGELTSSLSFTHTTVDPITGDATLALRYRNNDVGPENNAWRFVATDNGVQVRYDQYTTTNKLLFSVSSFGSNFDKLLIWRDVRLFGTGLTVDNELSVKQSAQITGSLNVTSGQFTAISASGNLTSSISFLPRNFGGGIGASTFEVRHNNTTYSENIALKLFADDATAKMIYERNGSEFGVLEMHPTGNELLLTRNTRLAGYGLTVDNQLLVKQNAQITGSLIALRGITGSLYSTNGVISSSNQLFELNTQTGSQDLVNLGISSVTGSLIGITNGLMAFTAALDSTYATDAQLYQLYQATASIHFTTQSLNTQSGSQDLVNLGISTFTGSLRSEVNLIEAYTASLKAAAIVSSSTQISNYYKFAETASANTFYGTQTINGNLQLSSTSPLVYNAGNTNAMLFGFFDGGTIYGPYYQIFGSNYSNVSQRGSAEFVFDSRNGGYSGFNIAEFNGSTWLRKFRVSQNGAEVTGSFVVDGGITGSLMATNNVVSSSQQIQNYNLFAVTSSANTFYGNQTITGSLNISAGNINILRNTGASYVTAETTATNGEAAFVLYGKNSSGTVRTAQFKYDNGDVVRLAVTSPIGLQIETNDITRLTIANDGGINATGAITASNFRIANAGGGIDFSVTSNGSGTTTSELLNDYEEGTWTPGLIAGTSGTITVNTGNSKASYTKIGRAVTLQCFIEVSSVSSPVGRLSVTGFPFTAGSNLGDATAAVYNTGFTGNPGGWPILRVQPGTTAFIDIQEGDGTNPAIDLSDHITTGTELIFSVTYFV